MKFKEGNIVRLKHPTEEEKNMTSYHIQYYLRPTKVLPQPLDVVYHTIKRTT